CGARWILPRHRQSLQKFLKRSGASSVYLTVCWMFLGPSHACSARVSCPALARAKPQACRNMCGKMVKGIPARLPRRSNSVPKLLADIGPPRSLVNTYGDASSRRRRRRREFRRPALDAPRGGALFAPSDLQPAGVDLDLVPLQIAQLGSSKPVAVGQQDHGRVAMPVTTVLASGLDELLDLAEAVRHGCRSAGLACPLGSGTAAGSSVRHNQGLKARPHALNRFAPARKRFIAHF